MSCAIRGSTNFRASFTSKGWEFNGGDGADLIVGGALGEHINAGDGDDTISGGGGNDTIHGNDGTDIAMISNLASLSVEAGKSNSWILTSDDGVDTLKHIDLIGQISGDRTFLYTIGENNGVFGLGDEASVNEGGGWRWYHLLDDAFDVEGDSFSITGVDAFSAAGAALEVTNLADGIQYGTTAAFEYLAAGETATDSFSYTVTDSAGVETTQEVTVTVIGANDAPDLTGGDTTGAVSEDDVLTATGTVTASDVDLSDELSWSGGGTGDYGTLTIDAGGAWTYVLNNESEAVQDLDSGPQVHDAFAVQVSDGNGGSAQQTITVSVTGADDASGPVASVFNGVAAGDFAGFDVDGLGDVNGDGIDDFVVTAPGADPNGSQTGQAYVVYGTASGFDSSVAFSDLDGTNGFTINGNANHQLHPNGFLVASAAGDMNDDGINDIAVSNYSGPAGNRSGQTRVIFGDDQGFGASFELSDINGTNGFTINGPHGGASAWVKAGGGDVNADGIDDLLIGANYSGGGKAYAIFGNAAGFDPVISLASLDPSDGLEIRGTVASGELGNAVDFADVNNDGCNGRCKSLPR